MDKKMVIDTFPDYEECFDYVWERFPVGEKPTWHHWWLYRFLQISPSYWEMAKHYQYSVKTNENHFDYVRFPPQLTKVMQTFWAFGNVWDYDFTRWWYLRARFQFLNEEVLSPDITTILDLPENKLLHDDEVESAANSVKDIYKQAIEADGYPRLLVLGIPIKKSKSATLKLVEKYLKENVSFGKADAPSGKYQIYQSKIREEVIKDCYKVFEIKAYQEKIDLIKIAVEANVLRGAMADYKSSKGDLNKMQSVESMRSGTSRQLAMAYNLAENAARGVFPITNKCKEFDWDIDELKSILNRLKYQEVSRNTDKEDTYKACVFFENNKAEKEWHIIQRQY